MKKERIIITFLKKKDYVKLWSLAKGGGTHLATSGIDV
jgi:hypothetical protein